MCVKAKNYKYVDRVVKYLLQELLRTLENNEKWIDRQGLSILLFILKVSQSKKGLVVFAVFSILRPITHYAFLHFFGTIFVCFGIILKPR